MKKIIFNSIISGVFTLLFLVGITDFVMAYNPNFWPYYKGGADQFTVRLNVEKGWNMIPVFEPIPDILDDSQIKREDILAVYVYSPQEKKYLQVYPKNEANSFLSSGSRISASTYVSAWVYSKQNGELKFKADNRLYHLSVMEIPLDHAGWHFIAKTPDVIKSNEYDTKTNLFNKISGDCSIEKIFLWNSIEQNWMGPYRTDDNIDDIYVGQKGGLSDQHIYSYLIKISNACTFGGGKINTKLQTIPTIPD